MKTQTTINANSGRIVVTAVGAGSPVVLIHGALAEAFAPLFRRMQRIEGYRLIAYDRRGYRQSDPPARPVTMADHAADGLAVLDAIGIERVHVVGHSYGANVALQLASDAPERVVSLTLMEPPLPSVIFASEAIGKAFAEVIRLQGEGQLEQAFDSFMRGFSGPRYRDVLDKAIDPGAFDRAVPGIAATLRFDLPALQGWTFDHAEAGRITARAQALTGAESHPLYREVNALLGDWLPGLPIVTIPDAGHMMTLQNPQAVWAALSGFFDGSGRQSR